MCGIYKHHFVRPTYRPTQGRLHLAALPRHLAAEHGPPKMKGLTGSQWGWGKSVGVGEIRNTCHRKMKRTTLYLRIRGYHHTLLHQKNQRAVCSCFGWLRGIEITLRVTQWPWDRCHYTPARISPLHNLSVSDLTYTPYKHTYHAAQ